MIELRGELEEGETPLVVHCIGISNDVADALLNEIGHDHCDFVKAGQSEVCGAPTATVLVAAHPDFPEVPETMTTCACAAHTPLLEKRIEALIGQPLWD